MNPPKDLNIAIPAAIAALPGLNLSERAALAHVAKFPGCSNRSLSKVLGVSVRGAENILRRLRNAGHIRPVGKGRARRHDLMFPVEHHTSCGKTDNDESHTKCVVEPSALTVAEPEISTEEFIATRLSFYENCFECGEYAFALRHLEAIRERLEQDADEATEERAALLTKVKWMADRCFAFTIGAEIAHQLPANEQRRMARVLCLASAEKLALFRKRVESDALLRTGERILRLIGE